jgi:hypothetical protein
LAVIHSGQMLLQKKNFEDFYNEIRDQFPKMRQLNTWDKYDWSLGGSENSMIMSELSMEMANWVADGQESEGKRMMDMIERYFHEGDIPVISIIYTDFLVTIMEQRKEIREVIKKMMGSETEKHYKNLFKFYRERDTNE